MDYRGDLYRVDVLDGIRALSVLMVLWFHFWQQTWLMPAYQTPFLEWLGVRYVDLNAFRYCGYLFVDMMVLISAFSLFLPHARAMIIKGEPVPKVGEFYVKRAARILPSYLFCIIVLFIIALAGNLYNGNAGYMLKDIATHLTFTQMFFADTYMYTKLGVVLWTVALLVLFYAVFPLLAWGFRRLHVFMYVILAAAGVGFALLFARQSNVAMYVNQFPTFLPVFANGMAGACLYVWFAEKCKFKRLISPLMTIAAMAMAVVIVIMVKDCHAQSGVSASQVWQLENRYFLSLAFLGFILFSAFSVKPYRKIFSNPVAKSLAAISFNLYIWHQWIMVELRAAMGYAHGGDVSAAGGNAQIMLTVEALALSALAATLLTYCVEKPVSRLIMKLYRKRGEKDALSIQ